MSCCCCPRNQGTSRLFSWLSGRHRRHYDKKGFEPSQRQLLDGIVARGLSGRALLEIGCGVGHLHQTLLKRGAQSAVGIDLAPKMLEEATILATERDLSAQTSYIEGDFVQLAHTVDTADVTILDKVVCCYPDADGLVHQSLAKTRKVYALTYPRDRWYTRVFVRVGNVFMWLVRSQYRSYVHNPEMITTWIESAGFVPQMLETTWFWRTEIYERIDGELSQADVA